MGNVVKMTPLENSSSRLEELILGVGEAADELAAALAEYPITQAEQLLDDALDARYSVLLKNKLDRLAARENAARREWIRDEIIRRLRRREALGR